LIGIALALAMDAFAVSVAAGIRAVRTRLRRAFKLAFFFGGFQAAMPVLGWWGGLRFQRWIAPVDHWIAFGILSVVGLKMILESRFMNGNGDPADKSEPGGSLGSLLALSIATSIDALAVGLSLGFLDVGIVGPALTIGAVTFVLTLIGFVLGERLGHLGEGKIEILGGAILIGIGLKILFEHLA
jgi:putative Mn2+ efflux pump MntP